MASEATPVKGAGSSKPATTPDLKNEILTSDAIINEQSNRLDEECKQLLSDIRRIGKSGEPNVTFGELFDDDDAQQYYEALVGTLKTAKKRGLITFKGQMLLKGVSDSVVISITE